MWHRHRVLHCIVGRPTQKGPLKQLCVEKSVRLIKSFVLSLPLNVPSHHRRISDMSPEPESFPVSLLHNAGDQASVRMRYLRPFPCSVRIPQLGGSAA